MKVKSIRDLGAQFTDNRYRMIGQDGAYSIPLRDGAFWFFGDTLIGERLPGESLWYVGNKSIDSAALSKGWNKIDHVCHNSGAIVRNTAGRNGIDNFEYLSDDGKTLKQLIPLLPDEDPVAVRIWCFHGSLLNDNLYLYYQKIVLFDDPDGPFPVAFDIIGSGLSVGDTDLWNFRRIENKGSTIFWDSQCPQFGAVVLNAPKEEHLYIYGVKKSADSVQECYVARVSRPEIEELSSYEYYTGDRWSDEISDAKPLFSHPPNELSVSYNEYLGCYLSVHSKDLTGQIVARTAPDPWGPWSEEYILYDAKGTRSVPAPYPELIYAAKEHPELAEESGKIIYITYVEFEEYYPHLIEIELQ